MSSDELTKLLSQGNARQYDEAVRQAHQHTDPYDPELRLALRWEVVQRAANCYPEYEERSLEVIENFLHYLPAPQIYIPHQPFIKSLIASEQRGALTEEQVIPELEFHCKRIRNDDMKKWGWAKQGKYKQSDYDLYETHLAAYKQKARQRLCEIIGFEPPLEHSLGAELYMRNVFLDDNYHDDQPYTLYEKRAVTIGLYREAMLEGGPEVADDSMLFGVFICNSIHRSPYTGKKIIS